MYTIPPEHPDEVAALRRLRAAFRALDAASGDWYKVCEKHGLRDEYDEEVISHVIELYELILGGRPKRQELLEMVAEGWVVPMFDVDGNPVMRDGEQMYTDLDVERTERRVTEFALGGFLTETIQWMESYNASEQEASAYLRGRYGLYLPDDETDFIVQQADKILRGRA